MDSSLMPIMMGVLIALCGAMLFLPIFHKRGPQGEVRKSWASVVGAARVPLLLLVLIILVRLAVVEVAAGWSADHRLIWMRFARVLTTGAITASVFMLIEGVERVIKIRFDISVADNLKARRLYTQVGILSRTLQVVLLVIAAGVVLMSFDAGRQFGASLLASAGIASLIVGLAARPVLENILAGVQIALTQPIRIDDAVVIEGEWGWIEEIASTYVVVRIWDERRLVVPLRYFMEHPIENWTRTTSRLLGTVFIHCDFTIDVESVRAELTRLCESSDLWDRRVSIIQVTDSTEQSVQLRALVSASSSPRLWDLRVLVREGLIEFIRAQTPESLPRVRAELDQQHRPMRVSS